MLERHMRPHMSSNMSSHMSSHMSGLMCLSNKLPPQTTQTTAVHGQVAHELGLNLLTRFVCFETFNLRIYANTPDRAAYGELGRLQLQKNTANAKVAPQWKTTSAFFGQRSDI